MGHDNYKKLWLVYLIPLVAAVTVRLILFSSWLESPFKCYHKISGLDMKTVLSLATSFCEGKSEFSIYKLLFCSVSVCGGGAVALVLCQIVLGVITTLLITYSTLVIFRNRTVAVTSGILAALYSPELMYESMTLIESVFVFTAALSLATMARFTRNPSSRTWQFLAGAAAALPALVRFSGLPWMLVSLGFIIWFGMRHAKKTTLRIPTAPICLPLVGLVAILIPVSIFNAIRISNLNPIPAFPKSSYVLRAGADVEFSSHAVAPKPLLPDSGRDIVRIVENYTGKLLYLFKAYEIPDNLNYYFIREYLKPLKFMPGPLFLIPFATLGMIILLFHRRDCGSRALLLLYIASFAIPMVVFIPLGRYRLILLPAMCAFAGYSITYLVCNLIHFRKRLVALLVLAVAYSSLFIFASPKKIIMRAEDFVAYGNAMELAGGYDNEDIGNCYRIAYAMNPGSASTVINHANHLMRNSQFSEAEKVLGMLFRENPANPTVAINYASSLLGTGRPAEAEKLLMGIPEPESRSSKVNYYYQLGESRRMQGKNAEARICYELALTNSDNDSQKKAVNAAMMRLK